MSTKIIVLFLSALSIGASAPVTPDFSFSNFTSSSALNILPLYSSFTGFDLDSTVDWETSPNGDMWAILSVAGGGSVSSAPGAQQSILATTSLDFTLTPEWRIMDVLLLGRAGSGGNLASASVGVTAPCNAYLYSACVVQDGGANHGTISVTMVVTADAMGNVLGGSGDTGEVWSPRVVLTVAHNPEPVTLILVGLALLAIGLMKFRGL